MSKLMTLWHALTGMPTVVGDDTSIVPPPQPGEAHTVVADTVDDLRQYVGQPMAEAAAGSVEALEAALLLAIKDYLVVKFGPVVGAFANGIASKAVHLVLDNVESYLHGLATPHGQ